MYDTLLKRNDTDGAVLNHAVMENNVANALKTVRPSAMREVQVSVPNVTWQDNGGLDDLKLKLQYHWIWLSMS